jgi:hypothetical protein
MCNHPIFRTGSIEFILSLARLKGAFLRTRMSLSGSFASDIAQQSAVHFRNAPKPDLNDASGRNLLPFLRCGLKSGRRTCPDNHLTTAQS